jgi:DNA invertase Pin-like site-specific DNA recombinase
MNIGYARISTDDQKLDLQMDALNNAGCEHIYKDIASGAMAQRDGPHKAISYMRKGDTLVVWKLDRLGRSLEHLIDVVNDLNKRGVFFKSIRENIDTSNSDGKLTFHLFGALAEFERDIIRERTKAGLLSARSKNKC